MMRTEYGCHTCGVESYVEFNDWIMDLPIEDQSRMVIEAICEDHDQWAPECVALVTYIIGTKKI